MTIKEAKDALKQVGVTLTWSTEWEEFLVNLKDGEEATAYYTDNLRDAHETGLAMAEQRLQ
jgi:hypothetical protein